MHFTDDNTLESILERQGDGLVVHPVEELGCITVGAGSSVVSLRGTINRTRTPTRPGTAAEQRSLSAL